MNKKNIAILWFVAAAASLVAAVLTYTGEGHIQWMLLAATVLMAAVGLKELRSAKHQG